MKKKAHAGQPTKYKPEFCKRIIDFYDAEPYEDVKIPHYKDKQIQWEDFRRMPGKLPTVVEFAKSIGVCYATVYDWLDSKTGSFQKEFLQAYTRAKKAQENFIIQNGLQGLYNPVFAKFVAINITEMRDSPLVDNSTHLHFVYDYRTAPKNNAIRPDTRSTGKPAQPDATESIGVGRQSTLDAA